MQKLTNRLQAIADLIKPCECVADVGCDHGFLSIYLMQNHIAARVIASDIHAGPIAIAREHFSEQELNNCITTIQCDGLTGYREFPDAVVIAGMGGLTMLGILKGRPDILDGCSQLILQPQSELMQFRMQLCALGFAITEENFIIEDGKNYPMMRAEHGHMELTDEEAMYGPLLLDNQNAMLKHFLEEEEKMKRKLLSDISGIDSIKANNRVLELNAELELNRKAYARITRKQ